jgi:hypothetical protein
MSFRTLPPGVRWPLGILATSMVMLVVVALVSSAWNRHEVRQASTAEPVGVATLKQVFENPEAYRWDVWELDGKLTWVNSRFAIFRSDSPNDIFSSLELSFVDAQQRQLSGQHIRVTCRVGADRSGGFYIESHWTELDACRDLSPFDANRP